MIETGNSLKQLIDNDQQGIHQDKVQSNLIKFPKLIQQENVNKKIQKNSISQYPLQQSNFPSIYKHSRENYSKNLINESNQKDLPEKLQLQSVIKRNQESKQNTRISKGELLMQDERQEKILYDSEIDMKNLDKQNRFNENIQETSNQLNQSYKEDFFKMMQKRTTMISNQHKLKIKKTEQMEPIESDMSDFQQRIIENRQFIKKEVKKKKIQIQKVHNTKVNKKNTKPRNRNESLYEKRIKEYKQMNENKYLKEKKKEYAIKQQKQKEQQRIERQRQKQKQKIKQQNIFQKQLHEIEKKQSTERMKQKKEFSKKIESKQLLMRYSPTLHLSNQKKKTNISKQQQGNQQTNKMSNNNNNINAIININQNLFEDLHNILENPHKSRSELGYFTKIKTIKNIRHDILLLERKYKQLELKEGEKSLNSHNITQQLSLMKQKLKKQPIDINLVDWNRFCVTRNKQLQFSESNFANEIEKISYYLNKNEQSIENYIQNKQHLIELDINVQKYQDVGQNKRNGQRKQRQPEDYN